MDFYRNVAKEELDEAEAGKSTGIAILSFISVVTLIFYFFVKNALGVIRVKSNTCKMKHTKSNISSRCLRERWLKRFPS